ncbi:hypothetical protein X729_02060 [Mesorhizobium sp. L103C131B0]|nr:hypothetical protein X729_02060 [Mesorhizobium sp. L103C131B0]
MPRPSLFRPEMAETLRELVAQGHSLGGVAAELGVSRMTLHRWMRGNVTTQRQPLKEARLAGRAERAANRAAEAERLYGIRHARNHKWLRLPPRPTAVDATAARATLDLLLNQESPGTREPPDPADAHDEAARRSAERRAARGQPVDAWQDEAWEGGEPVELDDPRADW